MISAEFIKCTLGYLAAKPGGVLSRAYVSMCICMYVGYVFRYYHSNVCQINIGYRARYIYGHKDVFQEPNPILLNLMCG